MVLDILTPKGREFKGESELVLAPSLLGQISVLPSHAPLVSVLKPGRIKVKTKEKEFTLQIEGGILQTDGKETTILLKSFH